MSEEQNNNSQIVRIDASNCFVESLSDMFDKRRIHFNFAAYDLNKPAGERQTNRVSIYLSESEFLETCNYICSYIMRSELLCRKEEENGKPVREWLGGTSAEKLNAYGNARKDGMSLSRVAKITAAKKKDLFFTAESGPGEKDAKGLIVPKYGKTPENRVSVSMPYEALVQLFLTTRVHYEAFLISEYQLGKGTIKK